LIRIKRFLGCDLLLVAIASVIMLVVGLKAPIWVWVRLGLTEAKRSVNDLAYYNVSFLSANYFDVGFVRRGLGGSIARLLSSDAQLGAFLFHIGSAIFLIAPLATLQLRLLRQGHRPTAVFMMFFLVLSPQTFSGWANDIARTDMLVIASISWSVIAMLGSRPLVSVAVLIAGFLVHETAIIFGVPLLVAIGVLQARDGKMKYSDLAFGALVLIVTLLGFVLVQGALTPNIKDFSSFMRQNTPPPIDQWHENLRECAIYMMVAGMRGLKTAICYNFYWKAYLIMLIFSVLVCLANGFALGLERRVMWFALAVMAPTLFMDAIANDSGRWVKFACASTWLLSAAYQEKGGLVFRNNRLWMSAVTLGLLLYMGTSPVHEVNRVSASVVRRSGLDAAPEVDQWMTHCDPEWREVTQR
jgi:hypothetical protein